MTPHLATPSAKSASSDYLSSSASACSPASAVPARLMPKKKNQVIQIEEQREQFQEEQQALQLERLNQNLEGLKQKLETLRKGKAPEQPGQANINFKEVLKQTEKQSRELEATCKWWKKDEPVFHSDMLRGQIHYQMGHSDTKYWCKKAFVRYMSAKNNGYNPTEKEIKEAYNIGINLIDIYTKIDLEHLGNSDTGFLLWAIKNYKSALYISRQIESPFTPIIEAKRNELEEMLRFRIWVAKFTLYHPKSSWSTLKLILDDKMGRRFSRWGVVNYYDMQASLEFTLNGILMKQAITWFQIFKILRHSANLFHVLVDEIIKHLVEKVNFSLTKLIDLNISESTLKECLERRMMTYLVEIEGAYPPKDPQDIKNLTLIDSEIKMHNMQEYDSPPEVFPPIEYHHYRHPNYSYPTSDLKKPEFVIARVGPFAPFDFFAPCNDEGFELSQDMHHERSDS